MFFLKYLRRELHRRPRQAAVIAVGLALGIALVITVTALSAGVKAAQGDVLQSLYGVGTDLTVTTAVSANGPGSHGFIPAGSQALPTDVLSSPTLGPFSTSALATISRLHDVTGVAGGLILTEIKATIPPSGASPSGFQFPTQISVVGVDPAARGLGPFSTARVVSGRSFTNADSEADVVVVDSAYAAAHQLRAGSTVIVTGTRFRVIGTATQSSQGTNPPNMYIPLARAQALARLNGYINMAFVEATSATDVGTVAREIAAHVPSTTVTDSSSLASQVSGSLATTSRLASQLGRWLAVLVLVAAFVLASLLTLAAVSRRAREFGTLKAIGWRSRRITLQVLGESIAIGIAGAAAGLALGLGGARLASLVAPHLSATVPQTNIGKNSFGGGLGNGGIFNGQVGGPIQTVANPNASHTIAIPFSAPVTLGIIGAAVLLAIAGGLIAGALSGWRIARLHPAVALARVE